MTGKDLREALDHELVISELGTLDSFPNAVEAIRAIVEFNSEVGHYFGKAEGLYLGVEVFPKKVDETYNRITGATCFIAKDGSWSVSHTNPHVARMRAYTYFLQSLDSEIQND